MDAAIAPILPIQTRGKQLNLFERYLTVWVGLCMVVGIVLGQRLLPPYKFCEGWSLAKAGHVNSPIAVLIWLMNIPMMKVDFAAVRNVGKRPRGLLVMLFVNLIVKPFSMAFLAWLFFRFVF
jgi:arsenite transporter